MEKLNNSHCVLHADESLLFYEGNDEINSLHFST